MTFLASRCQCVWLEWPVVLKNYSSGTYDLKDLKVDDTLMKM